MVHHYERFMNAGSAWREGEKETEQGRVERRAETGRDRDGGNKAGRDRERDKAKGQRPSHREAESWQT
jgi:hypothetical protein